MLPARAVCREEVSHTATYFCLITEAALQVIVRAEAAAGRPRLAYPHRLHDGRSQLATWPRFETRSQRLYAAGRTGFLIDEKPANWQLAVSVLVFAA